MFLSDKWQDFAVLDSGDGMKLERWGDYILSRPEPQAVWPRQDKRAWDKADAIYHRSKSGGGEWEMRSQLPESWQVGYDGLRFHVRPTGFKHTGLFPEQADNWDYVSRLIREEKRDISVLNLFAYTGGATLACAKAGASVVHVDAAKGMVNWAKDNAKLSGLGDAPIRYIVDDCLAFVRREQRRGHQYDGIIMDPPSYGRGPNGQMFRFEDHIYELLEACVMLLSDMPLFFLLNSYSSGFAPQVAENALRCALKGGQLESDNIGLPCGNGLLLPCGATTRWHP